MIGYYEVKILDAKKQIIAIVQIVGGTLEEMENSDFEKRKAIRASGRDPNLEKWDIKKLTFKAILLKNMDV